jgi:hypothetical protein
MAKPPSRRRPEKVAASASRSPSGPPPEPDAFTGESHGGAEGAAGAVYREPPRGVGSNPGEVEGFDEAVIQEYRRRHTGESPEQGGRR